MHHLTGIADLDRSTALAILESAQNFAEMSDYPPILKGKCIMALFAENSTRTRLSFEMAVKRLGGEFLLMTSDGSSLKKGESDLDNILTLNALRPDALIVRHSQNGFAKAAAQNMDCPVLNAGDGVNEHPTQALLDALTLRQHWDDFTGRHIVICGDTKHSRVAHSNAALLKMLGTSVTFCAPDDLMDRTCNIARTDDFDTALKNADAVMMLRMQRERFDDRLSIDFNDYCVRYQLNEARLKYLKPDAVIMHPGPMNRGVEITDAAADHPQAKILTQVENGLYTRMACLEYCLTL